MGKGFKHRFEPCKKAKAIKMHSGSPAVPNGTH